jgi:hypothetical protein
MTGRGVMLSELAQVLRPMSQGIEWFDGLRSAEQSETLRFLRHRCIQARAVIEDGAERSAMPDCARRTRRRC